MFAVTVEFLAGRYVATEFNDRSRPEWPPHPARLFSAAVAAWADHGEEDEVERAALEWWESLGPPKIRCSLGDDLGVRSPVTHFVPVNDTAVVARDTSRTYQDLLAAETASQDYAAPDKDQAKADKKLQRLRAKALEDSRKATKGVAPSDRLGILPTSRAKQARQYPTVVPADPTVTYVWSPGPDKSVDDVASVLTVLDGLVARIARVGHSSSPVSVTVDPDVSSMDHAITLEPGRAARTLGLRVPSDGQLENLIRAYEGSANGTEPRTMPARIETYRRPSSRTKAPRSVLGEHWILLEPTGGSRLSVRDVGNVAKTLRRALMSIAGHGEAVVPEVISGHRPRTEGRAGPTAATTDPHAMVLGLPFAGRRHATGEIMAMAVVLPQPGPGAPVDETAWAVVTEVVDKFLSTGGRLTFKGGARPVTLGYARTFDAPESARIERWSQPAQRWVSVTPVALDRNPGQLGHAVEAKRDAARAKAAMTIVTSCMQIGLPRPTGVEIMLDAPTRGTRPVHAFPPFRSGAITRIQVHAAITFDQPVQGPIVLGAGRFHGLGLFAPAGGPETRSDGEGETP